MLCMFAPVIANTSVCVLVDAPAFVTLVSLCLSQCISVCQRLRVPKLTDTSMWNMLSMWSMLSIVKHVKPVTICWACGKQSCWDVRPCVLIVKNFASNMIISMLKHESARRRRHMRAYVSAWMITWTNIHILSERVNTSEEWIQLSWYDSTGGQAQPKKRNAHAFIPTNDMGQFPLRKGWPQALHRNHKCRGHRHPDHPHVERALALVEYEMWIPSRMQVYRDSIEIVVQ